MLNIKKTLADVRKEDFRRLQISKCFFEGLQQTTFLENVEVHLSLGRQIASYFNRFLEGQMFTLDERAQLRFFRESYAIGGFIPDEIMQVVETNNLPFESMSFDELPIDNDMQKIRMVFEKAGLVQPSEEMTFALDNKDINDSFERLDSFITWIQEVNKTNHDFSDQEEEIYLLISRWKFDDRGLSRRFFLEVENESHVPKFTEELCRELDLSIIEANRLLDGLKKLSQGKITVAKFVEEFDASLEDGLEDLDIDDSDIMEVFGEDVLIKLEEAILEADLEDQERGRRKAKRRAVK